jgi:hypothetical protein
MPPAARLPEDVSVLVGKLGGSGGRPPEKLIGVVMNSALNSLRGRKLLAQASRQVYPGGITFPSYDVRFRYLALDWHGSASSADARN